MRLDFWFDYACPFSYLASTQVEALAGRTRAHLTYRPVRRSAAQRAAGSAVRIPVARARYDVVDAARFADLFGVPLNYPDGVVPTDTEHALRVTVIAGARSEVVHGFFRALWVEGEDLADRDVARRVLADALVEPDTVFRRLDAEPVQSDLQRCAEEAARLGIFDLPTFVVNGEQLFWGQDRLHFVERALRARARA